jgi:transcriptional antiterminator RfaH
MVNTQWYVLITAPRAEKKAALQLTNINIENYLPIHKKLKQWHDRKKWVDEVLFKRYLFVKTNNQNRNSVFGVPGIIKYLHIGPTITKISDLEIERIKKICKFNKVEIDNNQVEIGEEVEILAGDLIGLKGRIQSLINQQKVRIKIDGLGMYATVEVSTEQTRKIG